MRYTTLILSAAAIVGNSLMLPAQSVAFDEDNLQRGYHDRPWQRYEAEPELCSTNGEFLLPPSPYSQQPLQSEASRQTALSLKLRGDYVSWKIDRPGRGVTIRFSIPDSSDGKGRKGTLRLKVDDGREDTLVTLDSYWAWQYTQIAHSNDKYPDNTPSDSKFARMRFDEVTVLLPEDIPSGATLTLSKEADDDMDYTIDFLELEPVGKKLEFEDIADSNKVMYDGSGLSGFISNNSGKTIYIPEGTFNEPRPININADGTRILGAGMWYTTVYFNTPSDDRSRYSSRGFHCQRSNVELRGMTINTANNKRYYDNNPSCQVGKGLNGSWGTDSRVTDVRISHFECGGWITGARGLVVERCRFRNNYADGINLANNSTDCKVTHCSFRNNGDDDMASWSTGSYATNNEFAYNTAENNWRASSLGFFGGCRQQAHHIAIYDAMEAGARVTADFAGTGFSPDGEIHLSDITIRRCGTLQGVPGQLGGFWGGSDAALEFRGGYAYDLRNVRAERIAIYDSRKDAISIESNSGKKVINLEIHDITIEGVGEYAYGVNINSAVRGNGHFSGISAKGVVEPYMATVPSGFDFTELNSGVRDVEIRDAETVQYYNLQGCAVDSRNLAPGIYLCRNTDGTVRKLMINKLMIK